MCFINVRFRGSAPLSTVRYVHIWVDLQAQRLSQIIGKFVDYIAKFLSDCRYAESKYVYVVFPTGLINMSGHGHNLS